MTEWGSAMPHASQAHGTHGSGSRDFTGAEFALVWTRLERAGCALTTAEIALSMGINGRTVRAILSAGDGLRGLLAGGDDGYRLARSLDDAEALTRRLESQARKMAERARRRRAFQGCGRLQTELTLTGENST